MHNLINNKTISLPVYNNGTNEQNIKFAKETLLMDAVRQLTDIVHVKKHYPVENHMKIDFSLDVVILTSGEYYELLNSVK